MLRKAVFAALVLLTILVLFTGCDFISQLLASSEANIVSFSMDGIVGTASIDPVNHTVVVTAEPMDVSTVTPTVTVSESATLQTATLVDGQAATFRVTAEDGTVVTWLVTVNVQYGASFTYASDPTHVVLTAGIIDSVDSSNNTAMGNGVPLGLLSSGGSGDAGYAYAMRENYDWGTAESDPAEYVMLMFADAASGSYNGTESYFGYYRYVDGGSGDVALYSDSTDANGFQLAVSLFGAVGGDIVGTFSGTAYDATETAHAITNGFFKVRRIADDAIGG